VTAFPSDLVVSGRAEREALLFVNFHHVRERSPEGFPGLHHRRPDQLREQLQVLGRRFDFPNPDAVRDILHGGKPFGSNLCVVTFDDGLRDHYEHAVPVLAELGVTGVFFVNTGPWEDGRLLAVHMAHLLSARFSYAELAEDFEAAALERGVACRLDDVPPDALREVYRYDDAETRRVKYYLNMLLPQHEREGVLRRVFSRRVGSEQEHARAHYLEREMAREMRSAGHVIGIHSHRHLNLAAISPELRGRDLRTNLDYLSEALGSGSGPLRWISYPYGSPNSYDEQVVNDARALGCDTGLTMRRGLNLASDLSPMCLRRVDTNDVEGGKRPLAWGELAD
jgi:peptidoglycan/xylan/chitin deacetylase (PgdA/CDA1 family)